jgi:hypothetical protein
MKLIAFFVLGMLLGCARAQDKKAKLNGEELQSVKKDQAEIKALRLQFQIAATPFLNETNAILARECPKHGIDAAVCDVNPETGELSRRAGAAQNGTPAQKGAPAKTEKKK